MKNIFICSLVIVLCASCFQRAENESGNENLLSVNITDDPIALSDLYQNAKFIPFENGEKSMLSSVKKTIVKNGNIFLLDEEPYPSIKVFATNGEYIRNIGSLGHGKGEYIDIDDFTMNFSGDSVFILCKNRVLAYDDKGTFLFYKDIGITGVIRRIESCHGGYVCLTEYKGNDYLLHFLDYNFKTKKDLISSDGKIIKEPSDVINPIQVHGKNVWYYNWFNSTFYVVNTQDNYKMASYKINTSKAYKIEQFEDYVFTSDYDAVSNYFVVDNKLFGTFHTAQYGDRPFFWDLCCNEIKVKPSSEWIPYVRAVSSDSYYSILEQDAFIRLSKQMEHLNNFNNNYFDVYSRPITEKDNFILVELSPKK